jgi:hypothetical protein
MVNHASISATVTTAYPVKHISGEPIIGYVDTSGSDFSGGANADEPVAVRDTGLHAAIESRCLVRVSQMLECAQTDINAIDHHGESPLLAAIHLQTGIPVAKPVDHSKPFDLIHAEALFSADDSIPIGGRIRLSIITLICQHESVNLNMTDRAGDCALIAATRLGDWRVVELLLTAQTKAQQKSQLNVLDKQGKTALTVAIESKMYQIARLLLRASNAMDAADAQGVNQRALSHYLKVCISRFQLVSERIYDHHPVYYHPAIQSLRDDYEQSVHLANNHLATARVTLTIWSSVFGIVGAAIYRVSESKTQQGISLVLTAFCLAVLIVVKRRHDNFTNTDQHQKTGLTLKSLSIFGHQQSLTATSTSGKYR